MAESFSWPDSLSKSVLAALMLAAAVLVGLGPGAEVASSQEGCADPGHATDHIIVKMAAGASAESLETMRNLNGEGAEREFVPNTWIVDLPSGATVPEAVELYGASPDVEYAEPDHKVAPAQACGEGGASVWVTSFTDSPDPAHVGDRLTYRATVRNFGPDPAVNARLSGGLPDGVEFVSAGFSKGEDSGTCSLNDNRMLFCALGDMGVDQEAKVTIVVRPTRVDEALGFVVNHGADNALIHYYEESEHTTVLPSADSRGCTMMGTVGADRILGTDGRDVICGRRGNDTILGADGNDILYGGYGADVLTGGTGSDRLYGWYGRDVLRTRDGVEGNDAARGGPAVDTVAADRGDHIKD